MHVPVGEMLLYTTADGRTRVECRFQDRTIWLSQALIAEGEIHEVATCKDYLQVRREGKRQLVKASFPLRWLRWRCRDRSGFSALSARCLRVRV